MNRLEILKALERRRRKRVELNRSMVSAIQYQADWRRAIDRETKRAEHTRIRGQLASTAAWHPQVMRDRYVELTRELGGGTSS